MSTPQRLAAVAVGLLLLVGVAFFLTRDDEEPSGRAPDPAASSAQQSAEPTASGAGSPGPEATATGSGPSDEEALAVLAEIEEQVIEIRGLEAAGIGPPDIITRAQLGEELQQLFDEEYPPDERRRDNIALRALGLLEPDQDVAELQLQLLGDQVLGFYDDVDKRMVIVTDEGLDPEAKLTYAHEYTHALQDEAFGLDSLQIDAVGEDDRGLARTALIEGDATVTMLAWALEHLSQEDLLSLSDTPIPDTAGIPAWMVDQLQFPYTAGQAWVIPQVGPEPLDPDFAAIDAAYGDPPDSTEQILHQEKWLDRERPMPVAVPDIVTALGDGWEEVDATPIGQASIEIILEYLGLEPPQAREAARGWGGDRAVVASGPGDAFALAWRLEWDTAADAAEFLDAYESVVAELPFPATVVEAPGGGILVVHASSDETLDRTLEAAAGG